MRILWPHNFDPSLQNAGVFMHLLAKEVRQSGVFVDLYYLGNLRSPIQIFKAKNEVNELKKNYDLIHVQYGSACAYVVSQIKNIKKIISLRGSDWYFYRDKLNGLMVHSYLSGLMTRKALLKYDAVITMSNRMRHEVEREFFGIKVISLPDGIELDSFYPIDTQLARRQLGFPSNSEKWVLLTTLSEKNPVKRITLAKEAFEFARKINKNVALRVATGIDHHDMPLFVNSCDLILSTSVHEGWPNCIKEALACNVPFVGTDTSDLRDIARQEASCRICEPDPNIIANNILEVLAKEKPINLRRHIIEMDVKRVGQKLVDIYDSILDD